MKEVKGGTSSSSHLPPLLCCRPLDDKAGPRLLWPTPCVRIMLLPIAVGPPDCGVKGATLGCAVQWRYPREEILCARAQRPTEFRSTRPQYWGRWIEPLWGLAPIRRYSRGDFGSPFPPFGRLTRTASWWFLKVWWQGQVMPWASHMWDASTITTRTGGTRLSTTVCPACSRNFSGCSQKSQTCGGWWYPTELRSTDARRSRMSFVGSTRHNGSFGRLYSMHDTNPGI